MKKKVYRITFPDNKFYIGCTGCDLIDRLRGHMNWGRQSIGMGDAISEHITSVHDLLKMTVVSYEGKYFDYNEKLQIFNERLNPLMINKRIPNEKPKFSKLYDEGVK